MKKKSILAKEIDQSPAKQEALVLYRAIGRAEAFNLIEKISRTARIKMLKVIQDNKLYKQIPGCETMRDVFENIGVAKSTGYRELETLEKLGENMMELLEELGATSGEMLLLSRGITAEIEGIAFEVIDADQGEYRIDGRLVNMDQDREIISAIMQKSITALRFEKQARKGLEAELKEKKEELKKKQAKIEVGEKDYARLQNKLNAPPLKEITDLTMALFKLIDYAKQVCAMEITEEDERLIKNGKTMRLIENQICIRLSAKFNPRRADVSAWAEDMEKRNEHESEEDEI